MLSAGQTSTTLNAVAPVSQVVIADNSDFASASSREIDAQDATEPAAQPSEFVAPAASGCGETIQGARRFASTVVQGGNESGGSAHFGIAKGAMLFLAASLSMSELGCDPSLDPLSALGILAAAMVCVTVGHFYLSEKTMKWMSRRDPDQRAIRDEAVEMWGRAVAGTDYDAHYARCVRDVMRELGKSGTYDQAREFLRKAGVFGYLRFKSGDGNGLIDLGGGAVFRKFYEDELYLSSAEGRFVKEVVKFARSLRPDVSMDVAAVDKMIATCIKKLSKEKI